MHKLSVKDVEHVARLAKLTLIPAEVRKFQKQLVKVLDYIGQLDKVNTANIKPTSQTTGLENVFRPDEAKPTGFSQNEALSGTDKTHNGYFVIDAVLNKET